MTYCPSPSISDSLIHKAIVTGSLPHPTSRKYNAEKCLEFIAKSSTATQSDARLARSYIFIGEQLRQLRRALDEEGLKGLSQAHAILMAFAHANRNYRVIDQRTERFMNRSRRQQYTDVNAFRLFTTRGGFANNVADQDEFCESIVDSLPHWLHAATLLDSKHKTAATEFASLGMSATMGFSMERGLAKFWQQCLWLGWEFNAAGGTYRLATTVPEREILTQAWLWRQQNNMSQETFFEIFSRRASDRRSVPVDDLLKYQVVEEIRRTGKKPCLSYLRQNGCTKSAHRCYEEMLLLKSSHVSLFLDTALEAIDASPIELTHAWWSLRDIAWIYMNRVLKKPSVIKDLDDIRIWACLYDRSMVVAAVSKCCGITMERADRIVKFLTYDPAVKDHFRLGLWSMPLMAMRDKVAICLPALLSSSPIRRIELWLERGKVAALLAGRTRGENYERWVRTELSDAIKENPLLNYSVCIGDVIKPEDTSVGDIDLVIKIDTMIVVGEIKCLLTPTDAIEQYRYWQKLEAAATQARRKAQWIRDNLEIIQKLVGDMHHDISDTSVVPIVVVNQGFGFSLEFENCVVVDFAFLRRYIEEGSMTINGAYHGTTRATAFRNLILYRSEEEAAVNFVDTMRSPKVLERFISRILPFTSRFPAYGIGEVLVEGYKVDEENPELKESAPVLDLLFSAT